MIDYDNKASLEIICTLSGSVYFKTLTPALLAAGIAAGFTALRDTYNYEWFYYLKDSYAFSVFTFLVGFALVFRCQLAYSRFWEGRGSLESMTNQWKDACIKCVTFDKISPQPPENIRLWRIKIISLFSLLHGTALSTLHDHESEFEIMSGVDENICDQINSSRVENKVHLVYQWIQDELVMRFQDGGICIAPPISTRIWEDMTSGMQGYSNALMLHNTPFPFPYAQLFALLLLLLTVTCGYVFCAFLDNSALVIVLSFLSVSGYHALNYVALELEVWRLCIFAVPHCRPSFSPTGSFW